MYCDNTHSHPDRIVSVHQPYVRPITRGKDKHSTEFGTKIGVSFCNGFSMVDTLSWHAYSESKDLIKHVENYRRNFGYYPEFLLADKAYLTRENREFLKLRNIQYNGKNSEDPCNYPTVKRQ
jgi:IS5 family transposase